MVPEEYPQTPLQHMRRDGDLSGPLPSSGAPPRNFKSLEDLLERHKRETWSPDLFIRSVVGHLSEKNPFLKEYKAFLLSVSPRDSANYLVGSLKDSRQRVPASEILIKYGVRRETIYPMRGAFKDNHRAEIIDHIFSSWGPSKLTVNFLIEAFKDPSGAVVSRAEKILIGYGQPVLRLLYLPRGHPLYRQVQKVRTKVNNLNMETQMTS